MAAPSNAGLSSWAHRLRMLLMVTAVVLTGLVLYRALGTGHEDTFIKSAYGSNVGAAPGFVAVSLQDTGGRNQEAKIYLIDTNKRVACVYAFRNEKIRLVSARRFEQDMDILDASEPVPSEDGRSVIKAPEGNNGFDRKTAEAYAKGQQKLFSEAEKKR